jgi:hypothetical protein
MDLRSTCIDTPYRLFTTGANPLWLEEDETPTRIRWPRGNVNVDEADETNET